MQQPEAEEELRELEEAEEEAALLTKGATRSE